MQLRWNVTLPRFINFSQSIINVLYFVCYAFCFGDRNAFLNKKKNKGVDKHIPYLLAEVLETVELFTELYAVTCFGTRATTALSDTCRHRYKDYHRQLTKNTQYIYNSGLFKNSCKQVFVFSIIMVGFGLLVKLINFSGKCLTA